MLNNLSQYFLPEYEFYLEEIKYNRLSVSEKDNDNLICKDTLSADLIDTGVRLLITRNLAFEESQLFDLSVSYGAVLTFDESRSIEINWNELDLAREFKDNGGFVLNNLMSRISLLIAQITSSFGQMPLVLPPAIPVNDSETKYNE